jgi:imidazolonepropionase
VVDVADESDLHVAHPTAELEDCGGGVLTPGLVDSHTHAIFGRARYEEQELRAAGAGYLEIAQSTTTSETSAKTVSLVKTRTRPALASRRHLLPIPDGENSARQKMLQSKTTLSRSPIMICR